MSDSVICQSFYMNMVCKTVLNFGSFSPLFKRVRFKNKSINFFTKVLWCAL